jgi:hypothetical protein
VNRWYTCDITAGRDVTTGKVFDEAGRRDPGHQRTLIVLVDGDIHQLGLFQAQAAARGITITIVIWCLAHNLSAAVADHGHVKTHSWPRPGFSLQYEESVARSPLSHAVVSAIESARPDGLITA